MIKRIQIKNYRSLVDVTVNLAPLTVLIGRSGTGKSNFVRAVRALRDALNVRDIAYNSGNPASIVRHVNHRDKPVEFEVVFSINSFDSDFVYYLSKDPKNNVYSEKLSLDNRTLFHHENRKWTTLPQTASPPSPEGIVLGAIPGLQESTFAYIALRSGLGCYDFPGDVLTTGGASGNPADNGFADRGDNYLVVASRILSDLNKAANWNRIVASLSAVNPTIKSLTLNVPNNERIDVGYQVAGKVIAFNIQTESEGFRRFLAHMFAMYQNPSKGVLLFEHPESGLHPAALESLAEEFVRCPDEGRGQVIMTTHSPQLLDYFPIESIRAVEIDNQETRIGSLRDEQLVALRKHLLFPGELLTVTNPQLVN